MQLDTWLGFLLASLAISITPGPGVVLSISVASTEGYRAALRAIAGLQAAILCHLTGVALGLGVLVATSPHFYQGLQVAGALYLIALAVRQWRFPVSLASEGVERSDKSAFYRGILVNLLNPKAILFIAALLPQFIDLRVPLFSQYLVIASTMCTVDVLIMSLYALGGSRLRHALANPRVFAWQNRLFSGCFFLLGALILFHAVYRD